jgi:protein-L-isoaspartate O-methyltransferase
MDDLLADVTSKTALSPAVAEAFRTVPRHQFLDAVYVRQQLHTPLYPVPVTELPPVLASWDRVDPEDQETWFGLVYRDTTLVTLLDSQGIPMSSSTAPWLMATMLEYLDVRSGDRVLEIGTGTGYNAALLSSLVGPHGQVITVDIDPVVVEAAAPRLASRANVSVVTADGWHGYAPSAPYDKVISTAGLSCLCPEWIDQVRTGGLFLGSLQTSFAQGLARLTRLSDPPRLAGEMVNGLNGAGFIVLRSSHPCGNIVFIDDHGETRLDGSLVRVLESAEAGPLVLVPPELGHLLLTVQSDFMLLLQLACPDFDFVRLGSVGSISPEYLLILSGEHSAVLRPKENGSPGLRGHRSIADECNRVFRQWLSLGRPTTTDYKVALHGDGEVSMSVRDTRLRARLYECKSLGTTAS